MPDTRALPHYIAGAAQVIIGGLLAAVTAHATTQKTAWATAYVVLVGGVAQIILGWAFTELAPRTKPKWSWSVFVAWNLGNLGVLLGQLTGSLLVTDVGSAVLAVGLILTLVATWRDAKNRDVPHPILLLGFRIVMVVLAISIPIGVVLAHLRA